MNGEELQFLPLTYSSNDTVSIAYRFRKPEGKQSVFIWFCGFKSEMGSLKAEALDSWCAENGAGCLRFDYSGHGESGGRFEDGTIARWLTEANAVSEVAWSFGSPVFVGSSMGGWIALLLARCLVEAGCDAPKGLVLIAPAWDMTRLMLERASAEARAELNENGVYYRPSAYSADPYPITKRLIEGGEKYLFGEDQVELPIPVRVLHGCQDPDIPWRHSLALLDVIESPDMRLTLIKDGEHRLSRPQDLSFLFSTLSEFL
ncbi:MAG: alpha/beta fold hydrolase [Rhodomicrobium sp.]